MPTLFCVVVGEKSPFPVTIDGKESLSMLKTKVKAENPHTIHCDADDLQLYLASKDNGGTWLNSDGAKAVTLDDVQGFHMMDPAVWIQNRAHFGPNFEPSDGDIHVLVIVPCLRREVRRATLRATLADLVKKKKLHERDDDDDTSSS
ncbi:hypothetical protein DYB26_011323 [Aphanomyces astaci]|uniref:Crinkler effector protein N-terminal domain-containing protein n=1 Tax=Aphanomyces astaci TaxID=112090 RepID=A0A397ELV6_APHAT|nr:hypothetical protein DYB34_004361 [Aphanomyces astaci]RHY63592.1 hypothetical protein DYB38_001670 [Aphanomyces astaci]RHY98977.1 hypothetical protein DYB31_014926 [Aphanomyces astaci]RHZ14001.1 hypothetical protein DYB26_011323 [Aphanomyces astaci]